MERTWVMVRLRNVVMAVVLGTGLTGCSFAHWSPFHCDSCDDFPTPAYGPGFSMMPGTYTGPAAPGSAEPNRPVNSTTPSCPLQPSGGMPGMTPPANSITPPATPVATPGPGADARQPAPGVTDTPGTIMPVSNAGLPPLPFADRNDS